MKKKTRTLVLSTTVVVSANIPHGVLAQSFNGTEVSNGPFTDGVQIFHDSSRLDAINTYTITGGTQSFYDSSVLNAQASYAINGGIQLLRDNAVLNASRTNAINNGTQYLSGNSQLNANAARAINGGKQGFSANSVLNATTSNAIADGEQNFSDSSQLNASASKAIVNGSQSFQNTSVLNATATSAIAGGRQSFNASSALHATATSAISAGAQSFTGNSALYASTAEAIRGGDQTFDGNSTLHASVTGAINGGTQRFQGNSTLQVTAKSALTSTSQSFHDTSTLNAAAENILTSGIRTFNHNSSLNALSSNAITGGNQFFFNNSQLNAAAATAINGGTQRMNDNSVIHATVAQAISGGSQSFYGSATLDAAVADAVVGGTQSFSFTSVLNATASNAIRGGKQSFSSNSRLNASATHAINTASVLAFSNNSSLHVLAQDALAPATQLTFNKGSSGPGGSLLLNGFSTSLASINSLSDNSGRIANTAASDSQLNLAMSTSATSLFTGVMEDGGSGKLKLALTGGSLTLTGTATHTGGTTVNNGTLVVGDSNGNGSLAGPVYIAANSTLRGTGTLHGPVTVDGTLKTGISPTTFLFTDNLSLNATSTSVFELNSPALVGGVGVEGNDLIEVQGELSLRGTLQADVAAAGYYRLFNYGTLAAGSGYTTENVTALTRNDFAVDRHEVRYNVPHQVNLLVLGANQSLQFWDGSKTSGGSPALGGDGNWNGFDTNWVDYDSQNNTGWAHSVGVFSGTAGTVTVVGQQYFDTLQFSTDGYIIQGDDLTMRAVNGGTINGGTINVDDDLTATIASNITNNTQNNARNTLVKVGGGKLVLQGANTYKGGTLFMGGTTSVHSDSNLGDAAGALTFDGGMLQVTGNSYSSTARDIHIDSRGGAIDIVDANTTFTLNQDINGTGSLLKRGAGTLVLNGTNHYKNTYVQTGTLIADSAALSGNIANSGTLVFNQNNDGSFAGAITGLNNQNGTMVKQGSGTLSLTGTSLLDWTIRDGKLVAAVDTFAGNAHIDGNTSTLSLTGDSSTLFEGKITGTGLLSLDSSGTTWLTADNASFAGHTDLNRGTLIVGDEDGSGALGGSLTIHNSATLTGTGTVGSGTGSTLTVATGGTLSPGNPRGTMTVKGDVVFEQGSRFVVEVSPQSTESDLLKVTGNATLNGGTVAHVGASGEYDLRSTYTILSADGTLSGRFDHVTSDFAFITPKLLYNTNAGTVDLSLSRNDVDFTSYALTRNERATAAAISSIGLQAQNAVFDAITLLPDDSALIRASFNALSGEIYGSAKTALLEESRFVRQAANNRLRASTANASTSTAANNVAYGQAQTPVAVSAGYTDLSFWSQGFGSWGSTSSDGNAARLSRDSGGFLIGADTVLNNWRLGALAGYSHTSFKANSRNSSGKSDNFHLGVYGGTQWDNLALRAGAAYTWHHIRATRDVAISGFNDHLRGNYNAGTFQAFAELGYGIAVDGTTIEPFANLAHVSLRSQGFTEKGGDAALAVRSKTTNTTFSTLGVRAEHSLNIGSTEATLNASLGWRHAYGTTTPTSTHAFSAGNAFTIAGVPIAKNSALIEAGVDLQLTPVSVISVSWEGQQASKARDNSVNVNFTTRF
ncbi:MAG: autotransporter domain-containing protein [Paenalcaligenes sp.]